MFNHAPSDYVCPFCLAIAGIEDDRVLTRQADIVYRDKHTCAWISAHWWPNNPGHVLVVPVAHIENIYEMPKDIAAEIADLSRRIAIAMKHAYRCEGTSTRQHNEPAGYQEVWHFHTHVFPRWRGDRLYRQDVQRHPVPSEKRRPFAEKLRAALDTVPIQLGANPQR